MQTVHKNDAVLAFSPLPPQQCQKLGQHHGGGAPNLHAVQMEAWHYQLEAVASTRRLGNGGGVDQLIEVDVENAGNLTVRRQQARLCTGGGHDWMQSEAADRDLQGG